MNPTLNKLVRLTKRKNPFRVVLAYLLITFRLNKFVLISMRGYRILLSNSALARKLFEDKEDRNLDENIIRKFLRPGATYVDVGANIGTLALSAASKLGNTGMIFAIEAHPVTYKHLVENVEINPFKNIELINSAVGEREGHLYFSNIRSDDMNRVVEDAETGIRVPVNTLDNLLTKQERIELLKIDVEGYEKFVLAGALETLEKTAVVIYESWDKHFNNFGYNSREIIGFLEDKRFKLFEHKDQKIMAIPTNHESVECENLIAIKEEFLLENDAEFSLPV